MLRRVAFQGEPGAFGEDAIAALWPNDADAVPQPTFVDVVRAVTAGSVDAGVLPVENTIAGSVRESVEALAASDAVLVVGETTIPVSHCLMAPNGAVLESLAVVESHPVAIAQCKKFLSRRPWITVVMKHDTAGAARAVASAADPRRSAIAGRRAALRYGLLILAEGIQDARENCTRFVVIARKSRGAILGT